jgi:hypothetical protein
MRDSRPRDEVPGGPPAIAGVHPGYKFIPRLPGVLGGGKDELVGGRQVEARL